MEILASCIKKLFVTRNDQSSVHTIGGSCSEIFFKVGVLKDSQYSQKTVFESLFNKVTGLKACNFIEKRLQYRCFPVDIAIF